MPRLIVSSSSLIGTSGSDLVVGEEDNTLLPKIPAIGIEVLKNGVIDTQAGKDTIKGTGTGGGNGYDIASTGTGIANSGIINAGTGDDTIFGTGTGGYAYRSYVAGIGISNTQRGYINGGDGKDLISGLASGGIGIQNTKDSRIDGGKGDDSIFGTEIGKFSGFAIGISNTESSDINGGEGNDSIKGTGNGGIAFNGEDGTGIFNSGGSDINGGDGNDFITGIGNGSPAEADQSRSYYPGKGTGISNGQGSTISGGKGNDFLSGTGTGGAGLSDNPFDTIAPSIGIGIVNSGTISLGDGNDSIIGTGISKGIGILNTNGIICGGAGNDTLTGYGANTGIKGGTIDGGNGNDYFKARRIDDSGNPVSNQGGAIADVLIKGGRGADTFDVGYGNATIDGGRGWDKLILSDLKSDYTILGSSNNYTIQRDEFTLNVLNIEEIVFSGASSILGA
ncbi:hypothetical protein GNF10_00490 [Nostoc sp. UCD121]|uniref:calcium-binding protein n=1 Tax=unclassified Nostoc TaxID=2593658 RepID=UPI00162496D3|nr:MULTISPECIES: calcium-binding protein [unclassified Nostoc]MBC1223971.1 hypothetical protein [Nostoc sp. UCD120]MBC1274494.1 hypothetical protein [Nostoc sp. UCD121]MBC1293986.1 hypothetical protein [Nostoc sp. UCD122]